MVQAFHKPLITFFNCFSGESAIGKISCQYKIIYLFLKIKYVNETFPIETFVCTIRVFSHIAAG